MNPNLDPTGDLAGLGWCDHFARQLPEELLQTHAIGRVALDWGPAARVVTLDDDVKVSQPREGERYAVGDWVLVDRSGDEPTVALSLERRTALVRKAAGGRSAHQVVAANLDVVFVVTSMNRDFNPRRVARYLAAIASSGARAVVVLNKSDLDYGNHRRYLTQLPSDVDVVVTSVVLDDGLDDLRAFTGPGVSVGFVGMSGVGKSSLVNALVGEERLVVRDIRHSDDRGQHTTTHRELVRLPGGGVVIDTPGMRELGLTDADGVDAVFPRITELATTCRFRDCGHTNEPGCAVLGAIEAGDLAESDLAHWRKLQREVAHHQGRVAWRVREEQRKFGKMARNATKERERRRGG